MLLSGPTSRRRPRSTRLRRKPRAPSWPRHRLPWMPRSATLADLQAKKDAGAPQNKGAYDFFVSIGDQQAADILKNARYAAETHLGEESDASHIGSVRCVFQFIEECNAIRRSLGLGELRVTSEMMAYAISDCNWSDTSRSHARQFNVGENLAWGYGKESYQLGGYQSATATANPFYGWYDEEKAAYDDASFEAARTATDLGTAQSAYNQAHEDAETARTERESAKQAADGALAVLSTARTESDAADDVYVAARSIDDARIEQREVDQTYTADMTDPDNGISGLAARKVWRSIPSQLLRSSTKKFKYSEVERGGRRAKLIEPLD